MPTETSAQGKMSEELLIIDTNFLLIPSQFKVDIFAEIERVMPGKFRTCVLDKTLDELNNIVEKQRGKDRAAAQLAVQMLKKFNVAVVETLKTEKHLNVDKTILNLVRAPDGPRYVVATQDRALKAELKALNIPLIILRQKTHLKRLES